MSQFSRYFPLRKTMAKSYDQLHIRIKQPSMENSLSKYEWFQQLSFHAPCVILTFKILLPSNRLFLCSFTTTFFQSIFYNGFLDSSCPILSLTQPNQVFTLSTKIAHQGLQQLWSPQPSFYFTCLHHRAQVIPSFLCTTSFFAFTSHSLGFPSTLLVTPFQTVLYLSHV